MTQSNVSVKRSGPELDVQKILTKDVPHIFKWF